MIKQRKYDLEERFIEFAVRIIKLAELLPDSRIGNHIRGQILRCGTSPAPNYGEAQGAESTADFIHKLKIVLKELRETKVWLQIVLRADILSKNQILGFLLNESEELISIIYTSIETAKGKNKTKKA